MGSGDLNSLLQACVRTDSPTETFHPSNPIVLHFSVYRSALEALALHSQTVSRLPEAELIGWEFQIKFPVAVWTVSADSQMVKQHCPSWPPL